jgi:hypothetical protein
VLFRNEAGMGSKYLRKCESRTVGIQRTKQIIRYSGIQRPIFRRQNRYSTQVQWYSENKTDTQVQWYSETNIQKTKQILRYSGIQRPIFRRQNRYSGTVVFRGQNIYFKTYVEAANAAPSAGEIRQ